MDWIEVAFKVAGVIGSGLAFLVGAGLWMARREWLTRADFERWRGNHAEAHTDLDKRLDNGEVRFARIESKIDHLATRDDLATLSQSVSGVAASVEGLRVAVDGVRDSVNAVNRLTEMLLQNELKQEKS